MLTPGMYSDFSCKTFGLSYNQTRSNPIVRNAGWFNSSGERLGLGDISLEDLHNVSLGIDNSEVLFILSENDC